MIRVQAARLATESMDMRAGTDTALARVVKVFGTAYPRTMRSFSPPSARLFRLDHGWRIRNW
jgi:hypothetical protein